MLSKKECFYNLTKTTTTKKQEEAEKLSPRHFFLSRKPSKFKYNFIIWYRIVFFYPSRKRTSDLSFTKKKKNLFQSFQIHLHKIHKCLFIQPSNPPTEKLSGPVLLSSATSLSIHDWDKSFLNILNSKAWKCLSGLSSSAI